jgi:hypothetical protein
VAIPLLNARVIRHQFRPSGLNHLAIVSEDGEGYAVVFGPTLCGKGIAIGTGGWGYGRKDCPACFRDGAPAERIAANDRPDPL